MIFYDINTWSITTSNQTFFSKLFFINNNYMNLVSVMKYLKYI